MADPTVIIIGSGPTGAMAASELVERGVPVTLVDWGADDETGRSSVPDAPFSSVRRTHTEQQRFFLGEHLEGIPQEGVRVGAQLTPPRQFVNRDGERLLPFESNTFFPMQSLALGGLGAAWGSACFTFSRDEMTRIGLPAASVAAQAGKVSEAIGINGPTQNRDSLLWWDDVPHTQPPLSLDDNGTSLLEAYSARREIFTKRGFVLGRIPLAVLSQDRGDRRANPYHDLDFYGDSRKSVYRPRYTIEALSSHPLFTYLPRHLALRFEETADRVVLTTLHQGVLHRINCRHLMLCAGAIGSARIALNSLPHDDRGTTILSNPYRYIPTINLRTLGRKGTDRRHSLAQLTALCGSAEDPSAQSSIQIYSYRSLLLFKLAKEMPVPAWAGFLLARTLANSLAIFGVFSPDTLSSKKRLSLRPGPIDQIPVLTADYQRGADEEKVRLNVQKQLLGNLVRLSCLPIGVVDPGNAGSIHYAGTIPQTNPINPRFHTDPNSRLGGFRRVFVGDAASWNWLPCKGLTFTAMCNARRVAGLVAESLGETA